MLNMPNNQAVGDHAPSASPCPRMAAGVVHAAPRFRSASQGTAQAAARRFSHIVANSFYVDISDIYIENRGPAPVALARQAAIYVAHVVLRMTYAEAGAAFGRDRTTAAHACRCIEDRRDDAAFDRLMAAIERECAAALAQEADDIVPAPAPRRMPDVTQARAGGAK